MESHSPNTLTASDTQRTTISQEPSGALGVFAAPRMCIPMCKVETGFWGCKHQMLPKTTLAISPINQESLVGSACQHPLQDVRTALLAHLACRVCVLSLCRQPGDEGPYASGNYSTLILVHLWPMKSRPNSGVCVGVEKVEAGPKPP